MAYHSLHSFLDQDEWDLDALRTFLERDSSSVNDTISSASPLYRVLDDRRRCTFETVELLLNHGADVNNRDRGYSSPLHIALRKKRNAAFIRLLLERGADANVHDYYGHTTLCLSFSFYTSDDVVSLLLNAGCPLDTCLRHNGAILLCATEVMHVLSEDNLQLLIQKGFNLNAIDREGRSVLCHALEKGRSLRIIELLLAAGGSLSTCNKHASPLFCVTQLPYIGMELKADVVQMLLNYVERVSGPLEDPAPLQRALRYTRYETAAMEVLLDRLEDINVVDAESGNNLLHFALCNRHSRPDDIKLLVRRGVRVNVANNIGDTALHAALRQSYNDLSTIRFLIKNKSPLNVLNASGENPLMVSIKYLQSVDINQTNILKLLFIAGSRIKEMTGSILRLVIDRSDSLIQLAPKTKHDYCKFLLRCCYLENPNFDLRHFIQGNHPYFKELNRFGASCVRELQKLDSNVREGGTLRQFLCESSSDPDQEAADGPDQEAADGPDQEAVDGPAPEGKSYDFNQLLCVIADNKFPVYSEIIEGKVARSSMEILQEVEVYTISSAENVTLNYDCVRLVAGFLGDGDVLSLLLAFRKTDRPVCATPAVKEKSFESKKRGRRSQKSRKRRAKPQV